MRHALLSLLLLIPAAAAGGVPSPATSLIPCLRACPGGDIETSIVVRDAAGLPVAGSFVELRLDAGTPPCLGAALCIPVDGSVSDYDTDLTFQRASRLSDGSGVATFHLRMVGECAEATGRVRITADGVLLGHRPVASLDANQDWVVDQADGDIHATRLGSTDSRTEFVCDGTFSITQDDVDFFLNHLQHTCTIPLPVRESTWGDLKLIYR
jgi:hypothetical protein